MELIRYAQHLTNAEVPDSIRQSILAERATKSSTGVKVKSKCFFQYNVKNAVIIEIHRNALSIYRSFLLRIFLYVYNLFVRVYWLTTKPHKH